MNKSVLVEGHGRYRGAEVGGDLPCFSDVCVLWAPLTCTHLPGEQTSGLHVPGPPAARARFSRGALLRCLGPYVGTQLVLLPESRPELSSTLATGHT